MAFHNFEHAIQTPIQKVSIIYTRKAKDKFYSDEEAFF